MTVEQLITRAKEMFGWDLENEELISLLNDARRDAAEDSEYPTKTITAEVEDGAIEVPEDFVAVQSIIVDGVPWSPSDEVTIRQIVANDLTFTGDSTEGLFRETTNETGARILKLHPVPSSTSTVLMTYTYVGLGWSGSSLESIPLEFPNWFHPKLLHYAAVTYFSSVEDNPELAEVHKGLADAATSRLIKSDNKQKAGDGVFQIGIVGITA